MTTTSAAAAAAYDSSEEDRSLLFSDSEPESSQGGDSNYYNNISDDVDDLQWEDFMTDYWTHHNHTHNNTNSSNIDEQQLHITAYNSQQLPSSPTTAINSHHDLKQPSTTIMTNNSQHLVS